MKLTWKAPVALVILATVIGTALFFWSEATPAQTPSTVPSSPVSGFSVLSYQLVAEKRVSRTVSEFTYRATVRNQGDTALNVVGTATSLSPKATLLDAELSFGEVQASASVASSDTFIVRQDRTAPFSPNQLTWAFTGLSMPGLPPDPGEAGKATIEGIDSDNDGVRDDIQRYVGLAFPADPEVRMTLMRLADSQQQYLTARNSELGVVQAIVDMVRAWNCLRYLRDTDSEADAIFDGLESQVLDTLARRAAHDEANDALSGHALPRLVAGGMSESCTF